MVRACARVATWPAAHTAPLSANTAGFQKGSQGILHYTSAPEKVERAQNVWRREMASTSARETLARKGRPRLTPASWIGPRIEADQGHKSQDIGANTVSDQTRFVSVAVAAHHCRGRHRGDEDGQIKTIALIAAYA